MAVPVAWVVPIVALVAELRLTAKVSLDSIAVSPATLTVIVFWVSPGAKLSVPEVAV